MRLQTYDQQKFLISEWTVTLYSLAPRCLRCVGPVQSVSEVAKKYIRLSKRYISQRGRKGEEMSDCKIIKLPLQSMLMMISFGHEGEDFIAQSNERLIHLTGR